MYKLYLEKAEEPKIKLPTFVGYEREQRYSRKKKRKKKKKTTKKHLFCHTDYAKAFV